jgi:hypothetical protein
MWGMYLLDEVLKSKAVGASAKVTIPITSEQQPKVDNEREIENITVKQMLETLLKWGRTFDEIRRMTCVEFVEAVEKITGKKLI